MSFKKNSIVSNVFGLVNKLPYFSIDILSSLDLDRQGLKILLHRLAKRGEIISLKRGYYVTRPYIDDLQKSGLYTRYIEFIGAILSAPSYLSLEYVLSEHNLLTELSWGFTFVTRNKTNRFTNEIGTFTYRHVSEKLFCGFKTSKAGGLMINKATPAKALFDFLYLRKNSLSDHKSIKELRLNIDALKSSDMRELKKYVTMEGSAKMKTVFDHVTK
jgi:predicted transcriptional regulator of viral defense system